MEQKTKKHPYYSCVFYPPECNIEDIEESAREKSDLGGEYILYKPRFGGKRIYLSEVERILKDPFWKAIHFVFRLHKLCRGNFGLFARIIQSRIVYMKKKKRYLPQCIWEVQDPITKKCYHIDKPKNVIYTMIELHLQDHPQDESVLSKYNIHPKQDLVGTLNTKYVRLGDVLPDFFDGWKVIYDIPSSILSEENQKSNQMNIDNIKKEDVFIIDQN